MKIKRALTDYYFNIYIKTVVIVGAVDLFIKL